MLGNEWNDKNRLNRSDEAKNHNMSVCGDTCGTEISKSHYISLFNG